MKFYDNLIIDDMRDKVERIRARVDNMRGEIGEREARSQAIREVNKVIENTIERYKGMIEEAKKR